jgi:hypothetical protein
MVLELHSLHLVQLLSSSFDNHSLLSDTQTLQILETYTHLAIHVRGEEARSLHVNLGSLMVPEVLMVLLVGSERMNDPLLLQDVIVIAPAIFTLSFLDNMD